MESPRGHRSGRTGHRRHSTRRTPTKAKEGATRERGAHQPAQTRPRRLERHVTRLRGTRSNVEEESPEHPHPCPYAKGRRNRAHRSTQPNGANHTRATARRATRRTEPQEAVTAGQRHGPPETATQGSHSGDEETSRLPRRRKPARHTIHQANIGTGQSSNGAQNLIDWNRG